MSDLITITGGSINSSVFSITLPEQPLIANTAGAKIEITFDSSWSDYLNLNDNKNIKAIFTTQEVDPIAVYNDSDKTYWKGTGLTRQIIIPAQVYSAPGFTINIIGFALDTSMGVYSERYTTNSVYVRVYPSGPVSGSYIGLNPALDWADLVPTAISKADWAASTVTTLLSDFQECLTSYSELVVEASHLTLIDTVTTDTVDDNNQKGVKSQGIFNFVEATKHTQLLATKISADEIKLIQNLSETEIFPGGIEFKRPGATGTTIEIGRINTYGIEAADISATNISATNTTTTNLMVTSNAIIADTLTIPAGAKINATATSVTCININRATSVTSDPVLDIEVASTDNNNLLGAAIRLKSNHTYITGGNAHALLEVVSDGGTAARFWGTVGIKSILWLDGSKLPTNNTPVLVVGSNSNPGLTISSHGDLLYTSAGTISLAERKKNIRLVDSTLNKILNAGIYSYQLKESSPDHTKYGLVIGEGYSCPEEVMTKNKDGIDIYSMISFAWKGIQELNEKIVSLENRVAELEAQLNDDNQ